MKYQYESFSVQAFRDQPGSVIVNGWEVNYLSFCLPENQHKAPLILIGGAFQMFHSFLADVKAYLPEMPVLLVALPGQCSNRELRDPSNLSIRDMAGLLDGFVDQLGLKKISIAGFSYGSLLAYTYAFHYEERLESLVLVGCTLNLRHCLRQMLKHAIEQFTPETRNTDAEGLTITLFNLNAREETGLSLDLINRLTDSLRKLSSKDMNDYMINSARLLREKMERRSFQVRTLVMTAFHDHFILPAESLDVHSLFERGHFAMIERGDHLVPLQAPRLVYRTVLQFLNERKMEGDGVLHGEAAIKQARQRRRLPRYEVKGMQAEIVSPSGKRYAGRLNDVSLDGCSVTLESNRALTDDFDGTFYLDIGGSQFPIPGFMRVRDGRACFVFFKKTMEGWRQITDFVSSFQDVPCAS